MAPVSEYLNWREASAVHHPRASANMFRPCPKLVSSKGHAAWYALCLQTDSPDNIVPSGIPAQRLQKGLDLQL